MKRLPLRALLFLVLASTAISLQAQTAAPAAPAGTGTVIPAVPPNAPVPPPASNTPPPPTPDQIAKWQQVLTNFGAEKYADALAGVEDLIRARPTDNQLLLVRGNILLKLERWAPATDQFNAVLKITPKDASARYGLGEVAYYQKKYADARAVYQQLNADDPKNDLFTYKIFLTYLMEDNLTEAKNRLDKFDFAGNSPAYYFAMAAWNYKAGKPTDAESYIASSVSIFPPIANNLFADPLMSAGWLKKKVGNLGIAAPSGAR
ncbi:Tetratricopeptide repeat-containing protein [Verrucomicrobium sp. GAS474]|uniref:tetratricopeptide repeat protein n=1 Tax=Verrucomicrobium sp. GAS474 TaxID=1882831 RepID=UPI000879CD06|nr:tetratricopeptide repeat protein [Verrucomicrobium sp. GAS474]SDU08432.1 Tetratricopeptide repeat-containing protein [Verrucomicrobium sp. GAS474]